MSRTIHNSKGAGYDYWSRRLGNTGCQGYGPEVKKRTHKLERRAAKRLIYQNQTIVDRPT